MSFPKIAIKGIVIILILMITIPLGMAGGFILTPIILCKMGVFDFLNEKKESPKKESSLDDIFYEDF